MTNFEDILKQKLEQAEVPYNAKHWEEMDQMLDKQVSGGGLSAKAKGLIGTAALLTGLSVGLIVLNQQENSNTSETEQVLTQTTVKADSGAKQEVEDLAKDEEGFQEKEITTSTDVNHEQLTEKDVSQKLETETQNINQPAEDEQTFTTTTNTSDSGEDSFNQKSGSASSSWGKFSVSQTEGCIGLDVEFSLEGVTDPVSYLWDFGDGATSNLPNPTHRYESAGSFDVSLTLTKIGTLEDSTQTREDLITIFNSPEATLDWELVNAIEMETLVEFNALNVSENEVVQWKLNDKTTSELSFTHNFEKAGIYPVSLSVDNIETGCSILLTDQVQVENDYNLFAPTAFNPNSSVVENQTFIPIGLKVLDADYSYTLEVFNPRNGMERVYSTSSYVGWNGKHNNTGKKLAAGAYSWVAIVTKPDGSQRKFYGTVTLLQ